MIHFDGDALVYIAGFEADSRNGPFSHSAFNCKLIINKVCKALDDYEYKIFLTSKKPEVNFRTEISEKYKKNRFKRCSACWNKYKFEMKRRFLEEFDANKLDKTVGTHIDKDSYVERHSTGESIMKRRAWACKSCGGSVYDTKPVYYNRIREYLIKRFKAKVVKWGEADDWFAVDSPDTIATHDKDIYQVGNMQFYNLKSEEILKVEGELGTLYLKETQCADIEGNLKFNKNGTPVLKKELKGYGFKWFCAQMILGDKVDNIIKPYKGDGPVYIYNLLKDCSSLRECWETIKFYYHGTNNDDILELSSQLLWVSREPEQRGTIQTIEDFVNANDN